VGNLFGQGDAPVRDPPVSKAVPPVLAVKFQVGAVSGISVIGAPDLDAGPRVPREDRYLPPTGRRYGVRFVRRKARSLASGIESSRPRRGRYPWVAADTMISIRPLSCRRTSAESRSPLYFSRKSSLARL